MGCDSPLKGWRDRETDGLTFRRERSYGEKMEVACGQCLGCRLDYRRMWAMRITHEAAMHEFDGGNCFITLTYRDRNTCDEEQLSKYLHVPCDWSLHRSHFTNFMKSLRRTFPKRRIRYFYAGEYGRKCQHGIDLERVGCPLCNVGRPHFHACLFNHCFEDLEAYQSDGGIMRYTSPILEKIWGFGFVDVGELTFASASYVAGYVTKKMKGPIADDWYMNFDLEGELTFITPEFVGMSRGNAFYKGERCGIGAKWFEKYHSDVFPSDEIPVPGKGVLNGVPRYYDEMYADFAPMEMEEVKKIRKTFFREHKEDFTDARLLDKHKCKKARENEKRRIL